MENSYLNILISQTVLDIKSDISTIVPLKEERADKSENFVSICIQLFFKNHILNIYNRFNVISSTEDSINNLDILRSAKVLAVSENKKEAELIFDNGLRLIVDLSENGYLTDPEAMCLYGPDNFCAVWN